jgi:hypothetical protein
VKFSPDIYFIRRRRTVKCIKGQYRCSRIGYSGGKECCGYLLVVGETKFIGSTGIINEPCPLPAATEHYGTGENITQQPQECNAVKS